VDGVFNAKTEIGVGVKMLEQIDLFEITPEIVGDMPVEKENQLFSKWRMYEYLEKLEGKTALISYQSQKDDYAFRVPVQLGELNFDSLSKEIKLRSIGNSLRLSGYKKIITKIEKQGNLHILHYHDKENQLEKTSCATFEIKPYSMLKIPKKQCYTLEKPLSHLIGLTASVMVRCDRDELVDSVESLPFKILSIKAENGEIIIKGSNDVYIHSKGFQKVRESGNLIFDIYTPKNGYHHSFHLTI
jgi:hypothetical protein